MTCSRSTTSWKSSRSRVPCSRPPSRILSVPIPPKPVRSLRCPDSASRLIRPNQRVRASSVSPRTVSRWTWTPRTSSAFRITQRSVGMDMPCSRGKRSSTSPANGIGMVLSTTSRQTPRSTRRSRVESPSSLHNRLSTDLSRGPATAGPLVFDRCCTSVERGDNPFMNTVKTMAHEQQERLRSALTDAGAIEDPELPAGTYFLARSEGSVVTAYRSGKVLFQGHDCDRQIRLAEGILAHVEPVSQGFEFAIVGGDESGKGDLFGPLVVAAFAARDESERREVVRAGARDCKLMTDVEVHTVATRLDSIGRSSIRILMPQEYNARYAAVHNVNTVSYTHLTLPTKRIV